MPVTQLPLYLLAILHSTRHDMIISLWRKRKKDPYFHKLTMFVARLRTWKRSGSAKRSLLSGASNS